MIYLLILIYIFLLSLIKSYNLCKKYFHEYGQINEEDKNVQKNK